MENKDVILSIDGATKTGWAIYENGKIIKHGTKRFAQKTRIPQYGSWLLDMIGKYGVTHVVAENVYREHSRTEDKAFWVLANMQGVLEYITGTNNVPCTLINPLMVKSYMIPSVQHNRNEDKARMINRVKHLG